MRRHYVVLSSRENEGRFATVNWRRHLSSLYHAVLPLYYYMPVRLDDRKRKLGRREGCGERGVEEILPSSQILPWLNPVGSLDTNESNRSLDKYAHFI